MKSILLSIIIPVYNVEKYIRTCLESVYDQNVDINSYEVIVINDGTCDNSMDVIYEFYHKYNNLKIINQDNMGLSMSRNRGLAMALGDYVWFVDSDDTITCNCLSYIFEKINTKSNIDVFISNMIRVDEITGFENREKIITVTDISLKGRDFLFRKNEPPGFGATPRNIIRRNFLIENKLQFMEGIFHEDGEFGVKMLYLASLVHMLDMPIYKYLIRSNGSIMSSWSRKNSEDLIVIYNELNKFRDKFVQKNDLKLFNQINYYIIYCSISFANKKWDTQIFKDFYNDNKTFYKKEFRKYISFWDYGLKWTVKAILYSISPITMFKMKYRLF